MTELNWPIRFRDVLFLDAIKTSFIFYFVYIYCFILNWIPPSPSPWKFHTIPTKHSYKVQTVLIPISILHYAFKCNTICNIMYSLLGNVFKFLKTKAISITIIGWFQFNQIHTAPGSRIKTDMLYKERCKLDKWQSAGSNSLLKYPYKQTETACVPVLHFIIMCKIDKPQMFLQLIHLIMKDFSQVGFMAMGK